MSSHVRDLLPLHAAGALEAAEAARVAAHLKGCPACRAEAQAWRRLAGELTSLGTPLPSRALLARTRKAGAASITERAERRWWGRALGFVLAFAWIQSAVTWLMLDAFGRALAPRLSAAAGSAAVWYGAYLVAGWLAAAAAAVLLGLRARQERRIA